MSKCTRVSFVSTFHLFPQWLIVISSYWSHKTRMYKMCMICVHQKNKWHGVGIKILIQWPRWNDNRVQCGVHISYNLENKQELLILRSTRMWPHYYLYIFGPKIAGRVPDLSPPGEARPENNSDFRLNIEWWVNDRLLKRIPYDVKYRKPSTWIKWEDG